LYFVCYYLSYFLPPFGFAVWFGGTLAYNRYIPQFADLRVGFFYEKSLSLG
jgi:hypothetical protein